MGLFSIPVLVWAGVALPQAIGLMIPTVICQTSLNAWQHRDSLPFRDVIPIFICRSIFLPLGILLLAEVASLDLARSKQILGAVLLVVVLAIWLIRPRPRKRVGWGWTILAGSISGLFAGTVGMGGPPVSLWVMAHDWPASRQRAFLWVTFLAVMPLHGVLLIWKFGEPMVQAMGLALLLVPFTMIGAWVGGRLGARLNRERLRTVMLLLLLLIAIRSLLAI